MIRSLRDILRMTPEAIGLLIAAYAICHAFILIDFLAGQ